MQNKLIKSLLIGTIPSTLVYLYFHLSFEQGLYLDDYRYFFASTNPDFQFSHLGEFIGRSPLFAVIIFGLLKLNFLSSHLILFNCLFFYLQTISIGLIGLYILRTSFKINLTENNSTTFGYIFMINILTFYPNFLEVNTWSSVSIFSLGSFILAILLFVNNKIIKILLLVSCFCVYESFILPAFFLMALPIIFAEDEELKSKILSLFHVFILWIISLVLFVGIRLLLSSIFGTYKPLWIFPNADTTVKLYDDFLTYYFHYYNFQDVIDRVIFIIILLLITFKSNFAISAKVYIMLLMVIASALLTIFIPYLGLRIVYGSHIFRQAVLGAMLYMIYLKINNKYLFYGINLVILFLYIPSTYSMFNEKNRSAIQMEKQKSRFKFLYKNFKNGSNVVIQENCKYMNIRLMDYDTVGYLLRVFNPATTSKNLSTYVIEAQNNLQKFPVYFIASAIALEETQVVVDDNTVSGEALVSNIDNDIMTLQAKNLRLDSGSYCFHIKLKIPLENNSDTICFFNFKSSFAPAYTKVPITNRMVGEHNTYQTIDINSFVIKKSDTLDFNINSNGSSEFYIDYISISKSSSKKYINAN